MSSSDYSSVKIIVPGLITTDIIGVGVPFLPKAGEDSYGAELKIGPGGKPRNIAEMTAVLLGPQTTAMIGLTSKDPFGLWKVPIEALEKAGVVTDFVKVVDSEKFPTVSLVGVDKEGNRNGLILGGIGDDFSEEDLNATKPLFEIVSKNNGLLILTLEMPIKTVIRALELASEHHLRVVFDPGGFREEYRPHLKEILKHELLLIKPNEHEARMLTGIEVEDLKSAQKCAEIFFEQGIKNIFITNGENGAYLFANDLKMHIPIPSLPKSPVHDATGCGDQVMAAFCAALIQGKDLAEATREAILAGSLQFNRLGVVPVTNSYLH